MENNINFFDEDNEMLKLDYSQKNNKSYNKGHILTFNADTFLDLEDELEEKMIPKRHIIFKKKYKNNLD